jgi:predicted amidohydrolase YtcJ
MDLVAAQLPARSPEEVRTGLERALGLAVEHGIVALVDASADPPLLAGYAALDSLGRLPIRVRAAIRVDPAGSATVDSLRTWRGRFRGRRFFSADAAKVFVDGVIEARTAALLEPYLGPEANRGEPGLEPAALDTLVAALDAAGFRVHQHAIGDRAVRMALDAVAFAVRHNGPRDARHVIAHLQLVDPADLPRFAELGVIPSIQPLWAYRDDYITRLTEPVLGPERSARLYPFGSLARAGAPLAAGSDWPVTSIDPLRAIQVAVTRRGPEDEPGTPWLRDEQLSLARILEAYTSGGAFAMGMEAGHGTLELGKLADLIVLDRDLYRIPTNDIHRAKVLLTVVEGREVWRARTLR